MKKFFYLALALCMGFALTSCSDDDDDVATLTFEGEKWTSLVDSPQYGGQLLYGEGKDTYDWRDEATGLNGGLTRAWGGGYGYSEGGVAISNYVCDSLQAHSTYTYQLEVPVSNGSKNFAVVYCDASLSFDEGVSRVIRSMDICPTTYLLGVETYGDGYAASLAESGNMTLTITADNGKTMDVDFARDGNILKTWKRIDLTSLGAVNKITFTMDGSDRSDWGVKHPKYFALDNVKVELK